MWSRSKFTKYVKDKSLFIAFYSPSASCNIARTLLDKLAESDHFDGLEELMHWIAGRAKDARPVIAQHMFIEGLDIGCVDVKYPTLGLTIFFSIFDGQMFATDVDHIS